MCAGIVLTDGAIKGFLVDDTFVLYAQSVQAVQSTRSNSSRIDETLFSSNPDYEGSAVQ
jgi:hypothetical protein